MYTIVDEEIDEAGKYRVRVDIHGCTVMFKYDTAPTIEQVEEDAARYDAITYPPEPSDGASNSG